MLFSSSRHFRLWHYSVSHSTLLIRSPKGLGYGKEKNVLELQNTDLLFFGVYYMNIMEALHNVEVSQFDDGEMSLSKLNLPMNGEKPNYFALRSDTDLNIIGAHSFRVDVNDFDVMELDPNVF